MIACTRAQVPAAHPGSPSPILSVQNRCDSRCGEGISHDSSCDVTKTEPEICAYRFTRVVFGVSSCPFLLNANVRYHLESFQGTNKTVVEKLLKSTYVDDIILGADTIEEAFKLYVQAKEIFCKGGFNLRKFLSNCQPLQMKMDAVEGHSRLTSQSFPSRLWISSPQSQMW